MQKVDEERKIHRDKRAKEGRRINIINEGKFMKTEIIEQGLR